MKSKAEMLKEYFSFEIDDSGRVVSIPLLLESFTPNLDRLPLLLLRVATEVGHVVSDALTTIFLCR